MILAIACIIHPIEAILKKVRQIIKLISRNHAKWIPMEQFNQNHLAMPGRYAIEAILMKRRKVIEPTLRNQYLGVKS